MFKPNTYIYIETPGIVLIVILWLPLVLFIWAGRRKYSKEEIVMKITHLVNGFRWEGGIETPENMPKSWKPGIYGGNII